MAETVALGMWGSQGWLSHLCLCTKVITKKSSCIAQNRASKNGVSACASLVMGVGEYDNPCIEETKTS